MISREKLIKLIVIIIVIIIIIIILVKIQVRPKINQPTVPFSSLRDNLKTGDIIAVHGCSFLKNIILRSYLGCKITHIGMVIKKFDELYILELGPYSINPFRKTDARIRLLDTVLKEAHHDIFALIPAPHEIELTDEDIERYGQFKFNYFVPTMFSACENYKVCSNFISMIHHEKGILLNPNHHEMSPCDYANSPNIIYFTR